MSQSLLSSLSSLLWLFYENYERRERSPFSAFVVSPSSFIRPPLFSRRRLSMHLSRGLSLGAHLSRSTCLMCLSLEPITSHVTHHTSRNIHHTSRITHHRKALKQQPTHTHHRRGDRGLHAARRARAAAPFSFASSCQFFCQFFFRQILLERQTFVSLKIVFDVS